MKTTTPRNFLIILLAFLGLGAIGGGLTLIISPSGELMGMPVSILDNSPFSSFRIPGIVLLVVLGIVPVLLIFSLLKKPNWKFTESFNFFRDMHWAWSYTIYTAFAIIIWIQLQMMFIHDVDWLHTFYMFYAIAIIFVSLLPKVRNLYKKQ